MKILQINKYAFPKGGTETVLSETMSLLRSKGHHVLLFSTDEGNMEFAPSATIPSIGRQDSWQKKRKFLPSFFYNRKASEQLKEILEKEQPDIVHIHLYLNSFSVSILPVLKEYGVPVVMTLHEYRQICPSYLLMDRNCKICEKCIHGNYFNCMLTRCSRGSLVESALLSLEMYYRRLFYPTEKYVDRFICVSDFVLKKHQEFNPGIAAKSVVIKNPVSQKRTSKKRGEYLLYFGRLSREKGINTLLKAMEGLPDINLKIAGGGELDLNTVPANVEMLGFKSKEDLQALIEGAMFTVVPSEWYETFGMSCAESLALSTPVIAANIGALPELIKNKMNGFLFEASNINDLKKKIKEATSLSDSEYDELSRNAAVSVQHLSDDNYISKLLSLYDNLLCEKNIKR